MNNLQIVIILTCMLSTGCVGNNKNIHRETKNKPIIFVAEGLNNDGSLVKNYKRGLDYAIDYFGNYGPYYVYLMGPSNKQNILDIYLSRAETRANPIPSSSRRQQIEEFLKRPNITSEIEAVLEGKEEGGLTWSESPVRVYEDVTTNATERENNPIENTWGALHEYHHVFQIAHCDSYKKRTSDKNLNSWMTEGGATYSSAKFMENLNLVDFRKYMLELLENGGNISQIGINDFLLSGKEWNLDNETYWEKDYFPQVYYMLGAWATAYLIHVEGAKEITVLKNWYFDVPRIGKSAAFEKHMGLSLNKFYSKFDSFIRQPNEDLMNILKEK